MDVIDFDKPDENKVDFFEGIGPSEADANFKISPRVESPGGSNPSPQEATQNPVVSQSPEDSKDLSPEGKVLETVNKYLNEGKAFGIAADFDENIARGGTIDPEIRQAFIDMVASGKEVVIISSRGAKDVAERVSIPGVSIIGTLGWETLDKNGQSHINERFRPFQPQITGILRDVRGRFLTEQLGKPTEVADEPNIELRTPEGQGINLQRKGYNDEYPEGINLTLALSLLPKEAQTKYGEVLKGYYDEAFDKYTASMPKEDKATLRELCGFQFRDGQTSDGKQTHDVEIRPTSQTAKSKAMIQLMREEGDPKREANFGDMPYHSNWIYSGDSADQDGHAMRVGHSADFLSHGKRKMLDIWSKPLHEEGRPVRGVDVVVDGVNENAGLMTKIADMIKQRPSTQVPV